MNGHSEGIIAYLLGPSDIGTLQSDAVGDCPGVFDAEECKPGKCDLCSDCSRILEKTS